jgi:hypothetical protein
VSTGAAAGFCAAPVAGSPEVSRAAIPVQVRSSSLTSERFEVVRSKEAK